MTPPAEAAAATAPAPVAARDRGLDKGVGPLGLGAAVFNATVGGGIFALPAALAAEMGPDAPLAYLAVGGATALVALCFAAAGSRVPTSGGAYGFIEAAFGPFVGFLMGVMLFLGCALAAAGIAAAIADNAARLAPALAGPVPRSLMIIGLFAAFAAINLYGVRLGTGALGLITVIKLVPIGLLLLLGARHVHAANLVPGSIDGAHFGRALLLAAFAFQGLESALLVSGEVRRPERSIPLALLGALAAAGGLYIGIQLVTQGVLGPALAGSKTPLADAAAVVSPGLFLVLIAGAALSQLGYFSGDSLTAPRLVFALARDGYLPSALAATNPRTHAPSRAIVAYAVLGCALALSGGFAELVTLAALTTVVVDIFACFAAVSLQRRDVSLAGPPLRIPGLWLIAGLGVLGMVWLGLQASPAEKIGSVITLAAASGWYLAAKRLRKA